MKQIFLFEVISRLPLWVVFAIFVCLFAFTDAQSQVPAELPMHSHEAYKYSNNKVKEVKPGTKMPNYATEIPSDNFTINTNFTGSTRSQSGFIPPDTMGAVGPNHIVELINGRYAVYDKTGTFLQGSSLDAFWVAAGVTPAGSFSFDPRVIYDFASSKWFATAVDNAGGANNFLVAVSMSSDPTGGWTGFQIDSDSDDSHWADFPMLGLNNDVVVITGNMFPLIIGGVSNVSILVIPKSDLLAMTPTVANLTLFENQNANNTGFTPQPIFDLDNGTMPLEILSSFNKGAGALKTSTITGTATVPTLTTAGGFITVTARMAPPDIDQPGPKVDIDGGSARFSGNVVKQQIPGRINPSLWGVEGVDIGGRAAIEWYEIDAVTNALLQNGTITDTSLAFNYPSIAVNDFGDVVIGFSGGDPTTSMSTYVAVGTTTAGVTTFAPFTQTMAGMSDYQALDGVGRNRWGDYSATVIDPIFPRHFWTFQEFVSATDVWAVQITQIVVAGPTAANASVSGRVLTPSGRGIRNAIVSVIEESGNTKIARTNIFGYYRIKNIEVGQSLIFNVSSKGYLFTPQIVNLQDSIANLDFIGEYKRRFRNYKRE